MNQDITPPSSNGFPAPQGPGAVPAPEAPQQPAGQVIPLQSGPKKSKWKAVFLVLLFLLLLAAVAGAYYYQQGKVDDVAAAKTAADKQVVLLQSQLKAAEAKATTTKPAATTPVANYNIVTGNATVTAVGAATVNGLYKPGSVDEIWLEYGTAPDTLSTATTHITTGLGEGDATTYAEQAFKLTSLKSGQDYFYRVAAKAKGATIYGGVASFTAMK
jgi:zona occludens toxin (predicted ATPase)